MKQIKLLATAITILLFGTIQAQSPSYGTTGFNNDAYDGVPFASGTAYPSVMNAYNVANTGFSFHIGAIGAYVITQAGYGGGSYNGAITATNVTPSGFPKLYQTFAFTSANLSKFKLNSVKVKIDNASAAPVPMILAGVVASESSGSTESFLAMPGSNWVTVTTSSNPNFTNINGVIIINLTGTTSVAEMAFDDIDISTPIIQPNIPVFTTQPATKTVCSSSTTTFTATATNAAGYFWLMSSDGVIWNPINSSNAGSTFSGYNTNSLTVTNPSTSLNGLYIGATAVNSVGVNKGSSAARLYVTATPNAGTITGSSSVCVGSNITLANATGGGVWSIVGGRATNTGGVITGTSAGTTTVKYTVTSGSCVASATMALTVNALPNIPSIGYAPGTVNPGTSGGYCSNRTFTLQGTPSGGTWIGSGVIAGVSPTPGSVGLNDGVVRTGTVAGAAGVTYTYTNSNGCANSRTISSAIVICASRGVNASTIKENKTFVVYPNPSKGSISINLDNVVAGSNVTITNLVGKQVKSQALSIGNNKIDISTLSKGIYLASIITNEGTNTQKIIVE